MRRLARPRWREELGQSLLETALMMSTVFLLVFWVFEVGWLMYTFCVLADAANEGVRYSMVHSGADSSGTQTTVKTFAAASLHDVSAITTSVTFPDGSAVPPNRVKVTVTYTYLPFLSGLITAPTLQTFAEGRMVVE
jgi:Flp pilus assembly protein TadG